MISSLTQHTYLVITLHQYTNVRYQEFIRGISFRHLLKKRNMNVFLIGEFRTSKICSECNNRSLVTFKNIQNPRPHRRRTQPIVKCHGLVKYIYVQTNLNLRALVVSFKKSLISRTSLKSNSKHRSTSI